MASSSELKSISWQIFFGGGGKTIKSSSLSSVGLITWVRLDLALGVGISSVAGPIKSESDEDSSTS